MHKAKQKQLQPHAYVGCWHRANATWSRSAPHSGGGSTVDPMGPGLPFCLGPCFKEKLWVGGPGLTCRVCAILHPSHSPPASQLLLEQTQSFPPALLSAHCGDRTELVSLTVRSLNLPGPSCRGCVSGSERIAEPRCLKHLPGDSDTGDVEAGMAPTVHSSGNSSWLVYTHPTLLAPATHVLHLAPQSPGASSPTGVTRVAFWVAQGFHLSVGAWSSRGQLVEVRGHVRDGQVFILCKIPRNR